MLFEQYYLSYFLSVFNFFRMCFVLDENVAKPLECVETQLLSFVRTFY